MIPHGNTVYVQAAPPPRRNAGSVVSGFHFFDNFAYPNGPLTGNANWVDENGTGSSNWIVVGNIAENGEIESANARPDAFGSLSEQFIAMMNWDINGSWTITINLQLDFTANATQISFILQATDYLDQQQPIFQIGPTDNANAIMGIALGGQALSSGLTNPFTYGVNHVVKIIYDSVAATQTLLIDGVSPPSINSGSGLMDQSVFPAPLFPVIHQQFLSLVIGNNSAAVFNDSFALVSSVKVDGAHL